MRWQPAGCCSPRTSWGGVRDNLNDGSLAKQVSANTKNIATNAGNITSLDTKIGKVKTYVGTDGKIHFTDGAGADTALNFSSGYVMTNATKAGEANVFGETVRSVSWTNSTGNSMDLITIGLGTYKEDGWGNPADVTVSYTSGTAKLLAELTQNTSWGANAVYIKVYYIKDFTNGSTITVSTTKLHAYGLMIKLK